MSAPDPDPSRRDRRKRRICGVSATEWMAGPSGTGRTWSAPCDPSPGVRAGAADLLRGAPDHQRSDDPVTGDPAGKSSDPLQPDVPCTGSTGNVSSISSKSTTVQGNFRTTVRYPDSKAASTKLFVTELPEFTDDEALLTLLRSCAGSRGGRRSGSVRRVARIVRSMSVAEITPIGRP